MAFSQQQRRWRRRRSVTGCCCSSIVVWEFGQERRRRRRRLRRPSRRRCRKKPLQLIRCSSCCLMLLLPLLLLLLPQTWTGFARGGRSHFCPMLWNFTRYSTGFMGGRGQDTKTNVEKVNNLTHQVFVSHTLTKWTILHRGNPYPYIQIFILYKNCAAWLLWLNDSLCIRRSEIIAADACSSQKCSTRNSCIFPEIQLHHHKAIFYQRRLRRHCLYVHPAWKRSRGQLNGAN